jgi:hypothetical protein
MPPPHQLLRLSSGTYLPSNATITGLKISGFLSHVLDLFVLLMSSAFLARQTRRYSASAALPSRYTRLSNDSSPCDARIESFWRDSGILLAFFQNDFNRPGDLAYYPDGDKRRLSQDQESRASNIPSFTKPESAWPLGLRSSLAFLQAG